MCVCVCVQSCLVCMQMLQLWMIRAVKISRESNKNESPSILKIAKLFSVIFWTNTSNICCSGFLIVRIWCFSSSLMKGDEESLGFALFVR